MIIIIVCFYVISFTHYIFIERKYFEMENLHAKGAVAK